jgi:DnaJ-class molecular chaperone
MDGRRGGAVSRRSDALAVLGLTRSASAIEVKKKFKELARSVHPDVRPDPDGAAAFFALVAARDAALAAIEAEPLRCDACGGTGRAETAVGWASVSSVCLACRGSGEPAAEK